LKEHFKELIDMYLLINSKEYNANSKIGNIIEEPIIKISSVKKGENKNQKETVFKKLVKIKEKKIHEENQKNKEKQEFKRKKEMMEKEKQKEEEEDKSDPNFVEQKEKSKKIQNISKSKSYKSHLNTEYLTKNSEKKMDSECSTESFINEFFPGEEFFRLDQNIQNLKYKSKKGLTTPFISKSGYIIFRTNLDIYYSRDKKVTEKEKTEAKNNAIKDIQGRLEKIGNVKEK
jgi:hypothetical protein